MSDPKIKYRQTLLSDAYEQQAAQDWLPIEINQISYGQFAGEIREIQSDDVSVCFESQSRKVHKCGIIEDDSCTISFLRHLSDVDGKVGFSEYTALESTLFFLPSGVEFDLALNSGCDTVYFRLDQSLLLEKARAMNPALWENDPKQLLSLDKLDRKPLEKFSEHLFNSPLFQPNTETFHEDSQLGPSIMDNVLMTLHSASLDRGFQPDLRARRRARGVVMLVIEYIQAEIKQQKCPNIVDICYHTKISERIIQYSFMKILGLSPITYLRCLRLNGAWKQLAHPIDENISVTNIATQWHFWHLGRFSNNYLQMFGELPSETLRKSLA
jgi:AraC family transcriptional regulator, ethanolamine operon transcriptional activator